MPGERGVARLAGCAAPSLAVLVLGAVALSASCAPRTAIPPAPAAPRYPDFVFPAVPPELERAAGAETVALGWRLLQAGDPAGAERVFAAALGRTPGLFPARAGHGYAALARGEYGRALDAFDRALQGGARAYAPALAGRGQALMALEREPEALAAFEAAAAADPALDLRARIEVLRFRTFERQIEAARAEVSAGRLDEASRAYERLIAASPESAFLHRELGAVERRLGRINSALTRLRRAADLDPSDVEALAAIAEMLGERGDFAGAEAAYRRAAAIEPSGELAARIAATMEQARRARLPAELRAAAGAAQITRGELAALVGERFEELLAAAPARQVVITDVGGHWAAPWITRVARAGVIEAFENHTFQPAARVQRGDLAAAAARLLALAAPGDPALRAALAARPTIADMAPAHLRYPAVAAAVASGAMGLLDGGRFFVARPVTGAEAVETLDRLHALVGRSAPARP
jgi:tetratricopeptide (TPR) repeat protein